MKKSWVVGLTVVAGTLGLFGCGGGGSSGTTSQADAEALQVAYATWVDESNQIYKIKMQNCMYRDAYGLLNGDPHCTDMADAAEAQIVASFEDTVNSISPRVSDDCQYEIESEVERVAVGTLPYRDGSNPFVGECGDEPPGGVTGPPALQTKCHVGALAGGYAEGSSNYEIFVGGCVNG